MTTPADLAVTIGYQAILIWVAEGVIDRWGLTPEYRRLVVKELEREGREGAVLPAGVLEYHRQAAGCNGPGPRPAGTLPLDEYCEEK